MLIISTQRRLVMKRKAEQAELEQNDAKRHKPSNTITNKWHYLFKISDEEIRKNIGQYLHQVPEADSTCKMLLDLNGNNPNYITNPILYKELDTNAQKAYDVGKIACAVVRKQLKYGRGNVGQDIINSNGASTVAVTQARKGFDNPTLQFINTSGRKSQIHHGKEKPVKALSATELSALRAINRKGGNCGEHADCGYSFLNFQDLPKETKIFKCSNYESDHAFLIMAVPSNQQGDEPTFLICDPWIDFVGTERMAQQPKIQKLVKYAIYEPALSLVKDCYERGIDQAQTKAEFKNEKGKSIPNCIIHRPKIETNIFALPAIEATVGTLKPEYEETSKEMIARAAQAVKGAKSEDTPYYSMPSLDFKTGDAVKIPETPEASPSFRK